MEPHLTADPLRLPVLALPKLSDLKNSALITMNAERALPWDRQSSLRPALKGRGR
jgi:hypothetical protein